jgi:arylsulfatase A-like enzyme
LYLPHRNIHGPLIPNPRFRKENEVGVYGNFLSELDWSVGEILGTLDELKLTENTLVIFSSDNGGVVKYEPIDHAQINGHHVNGPLRGQKTDVYEGGVRVPLIARWPGEIKPGSEDASLIALTDMLATFADFFDVSLPDDAGEDSFSCLGALLGRPQELPARESLVCDSFNGMMSIRHGDWKLILGQHGGGVSREPIAHDESQPAGQLYNLARDLGESENLYDAEPEKVRKLTELLEHIVESNGSHP